jgi:demethylmenaquinone methyltransferase/2-methoxy-6-polyprenyl-1,4-benzoquinol methylase
VASDQNLLARELFEGIADAYEGPARLLSLGQYGRWRRAAVDALDIGPGAQVLDVATGTGLVARDLVRRTGARVVGLDLTFAMLRHARRRGLPVVTATAERLPFGDASFDALTFTYLLRYVDDPAATVVELARVLRRGGRMASVEFGMPTSRPVHALWKLQAFYVLPLACARLSPGWRAVGSFLGPSVESFARAWPAERLEEAWRAAGMEGVRTRRMTWGAGVVTVGTKR